MVVPNAGWRGLCIDESRGLARKRCNRMHTSPKWERACSRRRRVRRHLQWLIFRFREQARSHQEWVLGQRKRNRAATIASGASSWTRCPLGGFEPKSIGIKKQPRRLFSISLTKHHSLCRSCRRLRSFDFEFKKQDQKIAACGSSYKGICVQSFTAIDATAGAGLVNADRAEFRQ